jgi:hypothetical protein
VAVEEQENYKPTLVVVLTEPLMEGPAVEVAIIKILLLVQSLHLPQAQAVKATPAAMDIPVRHMVVVGVGVQGVPVNQQAQRLQDLHDAWEVQEPHIQSQAPV